MYNMFRNRLLMDVQQQAPGMEEFVHPNVLN